MSRKPPESGDQGPMERNVEASIGPVQTVLVAEDDPFFRHLFQRRLQDWGYNLIVVEDGNLAWEALQKAERKPDLVILDWLMPGIDGLQLCQRIRATDYDVYPYIVLVSGKDAKNDIVEGLNAGADDYLSKPFHEGELRARLRTGSRIVCLQQRLLHAQEELRFRASHDSLTGLWNGGAVMELLQSELHRANRTQSSTGVLMIDVDHFKKVNDTYGHPVGDQVLHEVAARITRAVRSYDFVGRYGGEEFIAVVPNCSSENLRTIAERALTLVAGSSFTTSTASLSVTVSIGGVESYSGASRMEILAAADAALYGAKRAGRNRVVIGSCKTCQATALEQSVRIKR
jgi:two-component system, cell cycle response regulator